MYFNLSLESLFNDMYKDNNYPQKNSDSNTLDVYVFPIYTTGKDYMILCSWNHQMMHFE